MAVLLLRLAAPLQAWGSSSRFARRSTDLQPTRSGVIGLLAAAKGMPRTASLVEFDDLRFGVRTDNPGRLLEDFQTTRTLDGRSLPLSRRFYLSDAVFLAGFESADAERLAEYRTALSRPYYPLFLGRRSCPPDGPIATSLVDTPLEQALRDAEWQVNDAHPIRRSREQRSLAITLDAEQGASGSGFVQTVRDVPISFDPRGRRYGFRAVQAAPPALVGEPRSVTSHDPLAIFSEDDEL